MEDGKLKVRAVERALDLLLCFTEKSEWGLSEMASRVDLHKSTVYRLLTSLEGKGFIVRDPETEKYRLGLRIWELSAHLSDTDEPAVILLPEMERLRDELDETISLYIRDGNERIRIQAVQSRQAIRRVAPVGARLPLYVGASSKVLLAFEEPEVQARILREESWPENIERPAFRKLLQEIRAAGFATSVEEREAGAAAVAAPILDRSGRLVAALSVSGPATRLTTEKMYELAPGIKETARRMGNMLK